LGKEIWLLRKLKFLTPMVDSAPHSVRSNVAPSMIPVFYLTIRIA
jgi:hypothetical protein